MGQPQVIHSSERFIIRPMLTTELDAVHELILGLQSWQKMKNCPRLPRVEDLEQELTHTPVGHRRPLPNNKGTFTVVAIDKYKMLSISPRSYVAGYLMYTRSFSILEGQSLWINSFFIREDYRKQGLGKKLIEFMRVHASFWGIDKFHVPVMNNNEDGLKFYARYFAEKENDRFQIMCKQVDS